MACVAVNLGIMSLSSLEKVPFSSGVLNMTKGELSSGYINPFKYDTSLTYSSHFCRLSICVSYIVSACSSGDGLEEVAYARYYHTRFPNMNTMYCLTELTGETDYLIYIIPVFYCALL